MENIMEHVVVKTEMQSNGDILLFYVDENGGNEQGVLTTVQNIESEAIEFQQENNASVSVLQHSMTERKDDWTDDETHRLLIFYIDNKAPFLSGVTKREHLWIVACKTMLVGKNPASCEAKLQSLRDKYVEATWFQRNGINTGIPFQDLCHQAFHNDAFKVEVFETGIQEVQTVYVPAEKLNYESVIVSNTTNTKPSDDKIKLLLDLYLKHKKNFQNDYPRKDLWDFIAKEIGEDDGIYWQKRFLNYKQHYIRMVEKRKNGGNIKWPYMDLFDKIFEDDREFQRKHFSSNNELQQKNILVETAKKNPDDWNDTEITVLAKYSFDCFDEFNDNTIPKNFLWTEIGRLLDKPPELCKIKYNQLKSEHYKKYLDGSYDINQRKPLEIILDYVLSKEVELQLSSLIAGFSDVCKKECIEQIVQFIYQNIELFKDRVCHFVCWIVIATKLKKDVRICKKQFEELVTLYKNILHNKKENPDMQIDWEYIDLFDRIFDYGMDTNLMNGYDNIYQEKTEKKDTPNKSAGDQENMSDDDEVYEENNTTKSKRGGDSKAFKILEYYQKNKDKFTSPHRNKHSLWEVLAKQIGISANQCAHRLRNLKQVYTAYVQREINKPEKPILWPYYILCKKVFGYRAIKAKLKNGKQDSEHLEEWSAKEIKLFISYLEQNFKKINRNLDDTSSWASLAQDITKTEHACRDKFLEFRKSYRKLKTQFTRNPNVKISWKYYNIFENLYNEDVVDDDINRNEEANDAMEVEELEEWVDDKSQESGEFSSFKDEEYECIIILPEDQEQDISSGDTMQSISENDTSLLMDNSKPATKWTKKLKKRLLVLYIKYVKAHKGANINCKEMWKEIGLQLEKTPLACRKLFTRLKNNHLKNRDNSNIIKRPYQTLLERIMKLKPKFSKPDKNVAGEEKKTYKDVEMAHEKVLKALQYYLLHIEEFASPKFDKKCMWHELASFVSEPVSKVYNKIHYLKQVYNDDKTSGSAELDGIIKEVIAKEIAVKTVDNVELDTVHIISDDTPWTDVQTKQLLEWYLSNLEKFKNPKFVRKYLWIEVSKLLNKSPLVCSKKMTEIRTLYRTMVKERPDDLYAWEFYDLCQKIYGTGKKVSNQTLDI